MDIAVKGIKIESNVEKMGCQSLLIRIAEMKAFGDLN